MTTTKPKQSSSQKYQQSLNVIGAVFGKEFFGYFRIPTGYVFLVFFVLIGNGIFFGLNRFFDLGQVSMRSYFGLLPWIYLFFIPAFSMGIWSEEKSRGTIEVLLSTPLKEWQVVLAKFLAGMCFIAIALGATITIPITMIGVGDPDIGAMFASYLGALFLGGAYLAIGSFLSSLTRNQIVSFIVSISVIFILLLIGTPDVIQMSTRFFADSPIFSSLVHLLSYLGLSTHFSNMARGVLDSRDVVYYALITVGFLALNTRYIQLKKWR
jgi:ABC-2 type transport system permease protein